MSQAGDFRLHYHIQDGGSGDATLAIVRRWERLLRSGDFPILCAGLAFSYASAPDTGMYQAINRGVAHARPPSPFLMGWINSDDRLAPGALAAIGGIYGQFPDVSFTCARVSLIDELGVITGINLPALYDQRTLDEGLHDGRSHGFVMQEGTFWRSGLWDRVDGLDERFRLAGDWDLWRRFARHATLFTIDSVLGFHRRHQSQLSSDLDRYHREVDAAWGWPDLSDLPSRPVPNAGSELLKFNLDDRRWERKKRSPASVPPLVHSESGAGVATRRVEVTDGARMPEGPYPEANLPGGMRWVDDAVARATVHVPYPGLWRMHLRIRNWRPDLRLLVMRGSTICLDVRPGAGEDSADTLLSASLWLEGGGNEIRVESEGPSDIDAGWLFILLDWYVLAPATGERARLAATDRDVPPADIAAGWPPISVVVGVGDQARLDLILDAIIGQGYPRLEICVVDDGSSDVNRQVLAAYAPFLDHVVTVKGEHRHAAIGRAVDLSRGVLIAVLDDTATLAPGALRVLADAFRRSGGLDLAVGMTVDEVGSTPVARRLPLLPDGLLSERDLLRIGLGPQGPDVFDRGALCFTRRIWHAAGGHLMAAAPAVAALDFWVRCARSGAALRTLPVDLIRRASEASRPTGIHRPDPVDVRSHAESLVRESVSEAGGTTGTAARSALRILLLDAGRIGDRPSAGCRRLAAALAAADQRVVCLVDDEHDAEGDAGQAASVLDAVAVERPQFVVVFGDRPGGSRPDVMSQLVACGVPTINVRGRRSDDPRAGRDAGPVALSPLGGAAIAEACGTLIHGHHGDRAPIEAPLVDRGQTAVGLRPGIDLSLYEPNRRTQARRVLGLPPEAFIILVVGDDAAVSAPRLAVAVEAYDSLDCGAKLLLVLGHAGELPASDAPVRRVDDQGVDDVNALFYAAADVVVSLQEEGIETPLVQAAASGTPAIVEGGVGGSEGPFGLRVPAWTPPLLAEGLRTLRADEGLYRRLSGSGVVHARADYSLDACAWSFMTLVRGLHGLGRLHLAPELRFPARPRTFALRPLRSARARPFLVPDWQAARSSAPHGDEAATAIGCTILEVSEQRTTLYLRARHAGPQRLRIHAASRDGTLAIAVGVNGDDCGELVFAPRVDGFDAHFIRVDLVSGPNRIDVTLAMGGTSPNRLMLRSLDLDEDLEVSQAGAPRPRWQPLTGFAEIDRADGEPSRWIDGPSATLRLWSAVDATRHLRLSFKNYGEPRSLEVVVNEAEIGVADAPTTDFLTSTRYVGTVAVRAGWNLVSLTDHGRFGPSWLGHERLLTVTDACLTPLDAPFDDESMGEWVDGYV